MPIIIADESFPVALREYYRSFSLPIYPGMSPDQVAYVIEQVIEVVTARAPVAGRCYACAARGASAFRAGAALVNSIDKARTGVERCQSSVGQVYFRVSKLTHAEAEVMGKTDVDSAQDRPLAARPASIIKGGWPGRLRDHALPAPTRPHP